MPRFGRRPPVAALPGLVLMSAAATAREVPLELGTATAGGGFPVYGAAFINAIKAVDPTLEIDEVNKRGSTENVPLLEEGKLDLALVQGEVVQDVFFGAGRHVSRPGRAAAHGRILELRTGARRASRQRRVLVGGCATQDRTRQLAVQAALGNDGEGHTRGVAAARHAAAWGRGVLQGNRPAGPSSRRLGLRLRSRLWPVRLRPAAARVGRCLGFSALVGFGRRSEFGPAGFDETVGRGHRDMPPLVGGRALARGPVFVQA